MKRIRIETQKELDALKDVKENEEVIIKSALKLNGTIKVWGKILFKGSIDCSYWEDRYFIIPENSQPYLVARENSQPHLVAWENSQPHLVAWENSQPHLVAWENSQPYLVAREIHR